MLAPWVFALQLTAAMPSEPVSVGSATSAQVEYGVYDFPLTLGKTLEDDRAALRAVVRDAQRRVVRFAALHGWAHLVETPFATEARIFDKKPDFDRTIIQVCEVPATTILPKTYSAALEGGILLSVSPALYAANYAEGAADPAAFEKLLAHEIAHRLHVRVLDGHEDDMGPIWFFEGFALYAAGQFLDDPSPTPEEVAKVVGSSSRGSYREYARVFRYLARRASVPDLVERARKPGMADWVRNLEAGATKP